jgi:hypothetical protein
MARSGSVNFSMTRDQIIQAAYELIGVAVDGEALSSGDTDVANKALNMMIKAWQAYDLQLWKREEITVDLVASQVTYILGRSGTPSETVDRPLKVLSADVVDSSGNSTELTWVSRLDFYGLPDATGTPTSYHYEPTLDNGTLHVWPTPTASTAASYDIELLVQSPIEDMDAGTDDFDFPQEWLEAITYNLAYRLAPRFSLERTERQLLKRDADEALQLVLGHDREASVFFQPDRT